MNNPVISICCVTYNHEKYIRQCIEGFLIQKTSFPIEIIIHDDASTDGTSEIVLEYADKHPNLIKPIIQKQNKYSTNPRILNSYVYPHAKGKYIATCEGDDYWTDPYKLQKQVDFLESHPEYVFCGHRHKILQGDRITEHCTVDHWYKQDDHTISTAVLLEYWPVSTLSMVIRKDAILKANEIITEHKYTQACDLHLFYYLTKQGLGYALPESMAVYRMHTGGVFAGLNRENKAIFSKNISKELYLKNKSDDNLRTAYRRRIMDKITTTTKYTCKDRYSDIKEYMSVAKGLNEITKGIVLFFMSFLSLKCRMNITRYILSKKSKIFY